jgi:hypothetical protein
MGLDVLRRYQFHGVHELGDLARPIMRTAAAFYADDTALPLP